MMTVNKRLLQFAAALWIMAFHLWMNLSGTGAEQFLIRTGYVGVDIFFFVSAYSLADKRPAYSAFLRDRLLRVYLPFVFFAAVAALYKGWSTGKLLSTVFLLSFFRSGGGSFLWFLPAIMLFYAVYPLFLNWENRYKPLWVLIGWFLLSLACDKLLGYTKLFIFTNRVPVIVLGYCVKKHSVPKWLPLLCLPAGILLLYWFGYTRKLNLPFTDFYYVAALPLVLSLAQLSGYVKDHRIAGIAARATLEAYALQMIFGPRIVSLIYKLTRSLPITNLLSITAVYLAAVLLSLGYNALRSHTALRKTGQ